MKFDNVMSKSLWSSGAAMLAATITHVAVAASPAQDPLFLQQPVSPIMMLNMSNDHQLFFKLYDDYSALPRENEEDEAPDRTYRHSHNYYGYFDSDKCYTYSESDERFNPSSWTNDRYCNSSASNEWSGNFLNWSTMTRMDAVRKILYGGKRSTDTAGDESSPSLTVLERAFLPTDAHSFAKHYEGSDLNRLTPYGPNASADPMDRGITLCNTTDPDNNQLSQDVDSPPLIRVARGNFSLWASNERWQCKWASQESITISDVGAQGDRYRRGSNWNYEIGISEGNRGEIRGFVSGIPAYNDNPDDSEGGQKLDELVARVRVCDSDFPDSDDDDENNEGCEAYGQSLKPTGVLQEFGQDGRILFGLMTGSYSANKSGGVLRKNVGDMSDEIDLDNGTFIQPDNLDEFDGIVNTLDRLRIFGYRYQNGTYFGGSNSDNCEWGEAGFDDGDCSNWGNPQSEIYLESLRYLAGQESTDDFDVSDSDRITGLNTADWVRPVNNDNYCAPLHVVQFNASTSSYDGDQLGGASDLGITDLDTVTNEVGSYELEAGTQYFIGEIAGSTDDDDDDDGDANQLCTAKTIGSLSDALGTCPDAPRLGGSYQIAGLARHARREGIGINGVTVANEQTQTVRTFGVALAPAVPRVTVPVPGAGEEDEGVTIQPACRNRTPDPDGNCAIVDFKIVEQDHTGDSFTGLLYVNWEDSEQGGDFDQDMLGTIEYEITAAQAKITTNVFAESTPNVMGFGYVISGVVNDGFHVHSGINGFDGYQDSDIASNRLYDIGASSAESLEQPLYYAAKWGGYADDSLTDEEVANFDPVEENSYFFATDPRELEKGLRTAFRTVESSVGSAASVATESTNLTEGEFIFQARFDSTSWTGEMRAYEIGDNGEIDAGNFFTTDDTMFTSGGAAGRQVYTLGNNGNITTFTWNNLSDAQQEALNAEDDRGQDRLNWLRGDNSNESATGGLRNRSEGENSNTGRLLGDIVNSSPVYLGGRDRGYSQLGGDAGSRYPDYLETKRAQPATLFVGANDGMLHALDVDNNMLHELFAYVPGGVYPKLAALTESNYGRPDNPHQYTVDGPLASGDAYINDAWRSVVVGTLGAGGKGVFALDVTDRTNPQVLFEINAADLGDIGNALGYVLGQPMIARMANGRWAAIFGNGYGSSDNTSQLFIVDLEDPQGRTEVIDTGAGTGLSAVSLLGNPYGQVQMAYAGDLDGNLWKFDLTGGPNQWDVALGQGNNNLPMFVARDDADNRQPITGAPTLGRNRDKNNAVMVYFGTGKYFETVDNNATPRPQHSFYAIADLGSAYTGDRDDFLNERYITDTATSRVVASYEDLNWATHDGWYMDFNTRHGERVIAKPLLLFNRLIFPTIIPSAIPCQFGGQSWLMDVPATGNRFVDGDGDGPGSTLEGNVPFDSLILGDPTAPIVDPTTGKLLISTSDGELREEELDIPGGTLGRQSWRQLR